MTIMLPGNSLDKLVCCFSPGGDALAIATPDGRVRTYDTGSGRVKVTLTDASERSKAGSTASGHLTEGVTCATWVGYQSKSKKKQLGLTSTAIAVGTAAGDVKLYDVQLGELKWRAVDCVEGGVLSLTASASQGLLYSTGRSCQITTLDVEKGQVIKRFEASKYPISCIALSPDAQHILGGGSSMLLWNVASQEKVAKYTGHPTDVRAIVFVPNGRHAASVAAGERHVAVWEVPPAKTSKKQHPAAAALSMEDPAVQLDAAAVSGQEDGSFYLAAVSEAGEAYVWLCRPSSDGLQCQQLLRVRVGTGSHKGATSGRDECIMSAMFQSGPAGQALFVARGSTAKPVFESVPLPADAEEDGALVSLKPSGGALLAADADAAVRPDKSIIRAQKASVNGADITVLGPENMGQPVLSRAATAAAAPASDAATASTSRKRTAHADDEELLQPATTAPAAAEDDEEVPDLPEDEVPLGERVAALEARALGAPPTDEEAGPSNAMPQGSAKADSLSVLLTQAIRSNDRALLERCLATSNPAIINNTVARIVPLDAAAFLRAAVDRLLSKPSRAVQLVPWIKAVLHHHTGYLMSAPGVQPALAALFQAIDNRVKLHEPLLKIYGRLGLILHHTRKDGQSSLADSRPGPEVVFEDDLDEEPAAEDPFAPGAVSDDEDGSEGSEVGSEGDEEDNEFDQMLANGGDDMDEDDFDDLEDL